jgi:hypothetical protein
MAIPTAAALCALFLNYAGKMLYGFGKAGYGFIGVAVFDAFPDTMLQMSLQNNLPHLMQGFFCGVYLNEEVLARDILIDHFVDCLYLPGDSIQPLMQIIRVHTLAHYAPLLSGFVAV